MPASTSSAADQAHRVVRVGGLQRLDERVGQRAVGIGGAPHQALHHAGDPHGGDVQHDADGRRPEMPVDEARAPHAGPAIQARYQRVEAADRDHRHPAEGAGVHVADGPVRVVREGVDRLDRHHRPFEGRHAVEGQRDDHELQDRIGAQLMPGTGERHDAVDHAAPGRREQHQREHHADRLRPVGQRGVVQVVRACPHVDRDQRPEVHDRQAIRVDRPTRLLRHEVVHHAEEGCRQEKADGVVAVPPLHHRIDDAGVGRVALGQRDGTSALLTMCSTAIVTM
jgi:hypothetical protein